MLPALFALVNFEIGSHFMLCSAKTTILLCVLPCIAGMTGTCHHAQLLFEIGSHKIFCPGWPQTTVLLISVSLEARITGMSHHIWLISPICRREN
jgi:hypothetical protein